MSFIKNNLMKQHLYIITIMTKEEKIIKIIKITLILKYIRFMINLFINHIRS